MSDINTEIDPRENMIQLINSLFNSLVYAKEYFCRKDSMVRLDDAVFGEIVLTASINMFRYFLVTHLAPYSREEVLDDIYKAVRASLKDEPDANKTKDELETEKAAAAEKEKLGLDVSERKVFLNHSGHLRDDQTDYQAWQLEGDQ